MTTQEIITKYGTPNETGAGYLTKLILPYPMRIAWDTSSSVKSIQCHKLIANNLSSVFTELLSIYGYDELVRLGIDLYGGCFNYRKMRGGDSWSTHSWGIAIDLDPSRNQLKENATTARFARPEYKSMIDAFYANGFINLGIEHDYDWMHSQIRE
jgi:hypothetical protein